MMDKKRQEEIVRKLQTGEIPKANRGDRTAHALTQRGNKHNVGRRPRNGAAKKRLAKIIEMAALGYTRKQMALELSLQEGKEVTPMAIRSTLYRLRKQGQLSDTEARLTTEAAPMAAEVIIERLAEGDKVMAIETLKGLGVFKTHTAQKSDGQVGIQALQVVFQEGGRPIELKSANVVGAPQMIDATAQ